MAVEWKVKKEEFERIMDLGDLDSYTTEDSRGHWAYVFNFHTKKVLKVGGPYKTARAAEFAEQRMQYL